MRPALIPIAIALSAIFLTALAQDADPFAASKPGKRSASSDQGPFADNPSALTPVRVPRTIEEGAPFNPNTSVVLPAALLDSKPAGSSGWIDAPGDLYRIRWSRPDALRLVALSIRRSEIDEVLNRHLADWIREPSTPLTNLALNVDLAAEALGTRPPEARRRLRIVTEEIERLGRLVANVLTFSRQERQTLTLDPQPCSPDDEISRIINSFLPALERRGIQVERANEADSRPSRHHRGGGQRTLCRMTILIAEDDPISLEALSACIEAEGFQTLQAANGREALYTEEVTRPMDCANPTPGSERSRHRSSTGSRDARWHRQQEQRPRAERRIPWLVR